MTKMVMMKAAIKEIEIRTEEIIEQLSEMDVILIAGGHVPTQNAFMERIGLKEKLRKYDGLVIVWSAGSMNCTKIVYAGPELEGEAYRIKDGCQKRICKNGESILLKSN